MVCKPKLGAAGRTAARKRLAAVKAAMRDKMKQDGVADSAYQDKQPEVEKVVFEAGFFRIESPVKSFPGGWSLIIISLTWKCWRDLNQAHCRQIMLFILDITPVLGTINVSSNDLLRQGTKVNRSAWLP